MKTPVTGIGLVGFGTVGSGTVQILLRERERIKAQYGVDLELRAIADVRTGLHVGTELPESLFTTDYRKLVGDGAIDILVELVGGTGVATDIVTAALKAGKHVVTANKALLADKGDRLFALASEKKRLIGFEASVCGGIPVIRALKEGLSANRIPSLFGILNGTANYILTRMRFDNLSFADALKEAQKLGFAEADPTFDIEGIDSVHKLSILASLSYGRFYHWKDIHVEGIAPVTDLDIRYAHELGYAIKLLAMARRTGKEAPSLSVAPTLVPESEIIAAINHEYNGVFITGEYVGHTLFSGKGAGSLPTGSAVVSDLVNIAAYGETETEHYRMYGKGRGEVQSYEGFESAYYVRLKVRDKPGAMAKISGILGDHEISIAMLMQKQTAADGDAVIVIKTHRTIYRQIEAAMKELNALDIVDGPAVRFRIIEDLFHGG